MHKPSCYGEVYSVLTEIGTDVMHSDPLEFTFLAGSLPGIQSCVNISITDDSTFESNHTFRVELNDVELEFSMPLVPEAVIDNPNATTITILDNDGIYCSIC